MKRTFGLLNAALAGWTIGSIGVGISRAGAGFWWGLLVAAVGLFGWNWLRYKAEAD